MPAIASSSSRVPLRRNSRATAAAAARRQSAVGTRSRPASACRQSVDAFRRLYATPSTRICREPSLRPTRLGSYRDACGRRRELVALGGHAGSLLVVDRDAATLRDRRLVAHLGSDEPAGNAVLICRSYLSRAGARRCRRLLPGDLLATAPGEPTLAHDRIPGFDPSVAIQAQGFVHRLAAVEQGRSVLELRWCRRRPGRSKEPWEPVALRETVAAFESYEPVRGITAAALACRRRDPGVSLRRLRCEYQWLCTSPVVLNRALREAVLSAIDRDELSMSEIALRCGMIKRDRQGKRSGETSWLARRVGLMPDGGTRSVTPWVHSDVLALIAREGLRVCPREVEVP